MDPSLDARGSERSLEVALADPAEGSDDVADDLDDSALSATASHGGHGCGEAARTDCEAAEQCSHRALRCTPTLATVRSRAREQALSACPGSPVRVLRDLRSLSSRNKPEPLPPAAYAPRTLAP